MNFIICEDEKLQAEYLSSCIYKWAQQIKEIAQVNIYDDAKSLLFNFEDEIDADVLLLDIEMPGMTGMELAEKIRERESNIQIIFITGLKDYVFQGYSVSAVSYLLKPVKEDELFKCFDKVRKNLEVQEPFIIITEDRSVRKIKYKDIFYAESSGHNTYIHTKNEEVCAAIGIQQIWNKLNDKRFFRIHRSYIVSIPWIEGITKKDVILEGNIKVPIARGKWKEINKAYLDYYMRKGE